MTTYGAQTLKQACIKTLSKSELLDQREFNGVMALKRMFGDSDREMAACFVIRGGEVCENIRVRWYDARARNESRTEFRFYYESNYVMDKASPGDNIVIGFDRLNELHCILFKNGSSEHQGNIGSWSTYK